MLKTLWKVWKSTLKTGMDAGLLNFFHGDFNMLKKERCSTSCIQGFLWKTFSVVKQTEEKRRTSNSLEEKTHFYGKESQLMLYFKLNQYRNLTKYCFRAS